MKIGIVGLPYSGKTTIFNAVSFAHEDTGSFSAKGDLHIRVVEVPDERLDFIREQFGSRKRTYTTLEFVDIPPGRSRESYLAAVREMDALILVIRDFEDDEVPHIKGSVDPGRDLEELKTDFILADLGIVEHRIEKLEVLVKRPTPTQEADREELALMEKLKVLLEEGRPLTEFGFREEERKRVTGYCFITLLPYLVLYNIGEEDLPLSKEESEEKPGGIRMCGKVEMELSELPEDEREIFSSEMGVEELASERIIRACYGMLDLITFFTANEKEARAWAIERGATAVEAAGKVHTDMARGFIRAEVINFADLVDLGSVREVKARGKARLEGRDHLVKDGDLIEFRFSR